MPQHSVHPELAELTSRCIYRQVEGVGGSRGLFPSIAGGILPTAMPGPHNVMVGSHSRFGAGVADRVRGAQEAADIGRMSRSPCLRAVAESLAASVECWSREDALEAISQERQPLLRRFLGESALPSGQDREGQGAVAFLDTLQRELPAVVSQVMAGVAEGRAGLAEAEADISLAMNALHWALTSRVLEVALRGCRLLSSVAAVVQDAWRGHGGYQQTVGGGGAQLVWRWLSARVTPALGGAIGAVLTMLRQHGMVEARAGEVKDAAAEFVYELSGRGLGLRQLCAIEIPARGGGSRAAGLVLLAKVLEAMSLRGSMTREALIRFQVLPEVSHMAARDAAGHGHATAAAAKAAGSMDGNNAAALEAVLDLRACALELLVTLWQTFPAEMEDLWGKEGGSEKLWGLMKNAMASSPAPAHSGSRSSMGASGPDMERNNLQHRSHELAFRLLEGYINAKSPEAGPAYRVVVDSLLRNYEQEDLRQLVQTGLGRILDKTPRMPLGILIEPLMKAMRRHGYTVVDLRFHNKLVRHPRLEPAQGLMLMDMMARVCISDARADCRKSATNSLVGLLDTLRGLPAAADFVDRLGRLALGMACVIVAAGGLHTTADGADGSSANTGGGKAGDERGLGETARNLSTSRKVAMMRMVERVARLQAAAFNARLLPHYRHALSQSHLLAPEIAGELVLLGRALEDKCVEDESFDRSSVAGIEEGPRSPPRTGAGFREPTAGEAGRKGRDEKARKQREGKMRRDERTVDVPAIERQIPRRERPTEKNTQLDELREDRRREKIEKGATPSVSVEERPVGNPDRAKPYPPDKPRHDGTEALESEATGKTQRDTEAKAVESVAKARRAVGKGKIPAVDRREPNMERARSVLEVKKSSKVDPPPQGGGGRMGHAQELPNLLTQEEVQKQHSKIQRQHRQPALAAGRPASSLGGGRKSANDSDHEDTLSLPDREAPSGLHRVNRQRPASAKTQQRDLEIALIKNRRHERMQQREAEEAKAKARQDRLFQKARREVEDRIAALKEEASSHVDGDGVDAVAGRGLGNDSSRAALLDASAMSVIAPKAKFNLKADAMTKANKAAFDLERHVHMWKGNPHRKQSVGVVVELLEEVFLAATTRSKVSVPALRQPAPADDATGKRKGAGARLKRGDADVEKMRGLGSEPWAVDLSAREGSPGRHRGVWPRVDNRARRSEAELEEMDRMLLAKSAATGDESLRKMAKRQAALRKKIAIYRQQRREAEEHAALEQQRLKAAMQVEKEKQREVEAERRKKLKAKIAEYKERVSQDRAARLQHEAQQEVMSKADRRKKLQEHLRKKRAEGVGLADKHAPPRPRYNGRVLSPGRSPPPRVQKQSLPTKTRGKVRTSKEQERIGGKGEDDARKQSHSVDLLRDDYAPSPTDLGATLDAEPVSGGNEGTVPLADSSNPDGAQTVLADVSGEAGQGAEEGDGAPGAAGVDDLAAQDGTEEGAAAQEAGRGAGEGDGAPEAAGVDDPAAQDSTEEGAAAQEAAAAEALDRPDQRQDEAKVVVAPEEPLASEPADQAADGALVEGAVAEEQKLLSPGGSQETWEATEE